MQNKLPTAIFDFHTMQVITQLLAQCTEIMEKLCSDGVRHDTNAFQNDIPILTRGSFGAISKSAH